MTDRDLGSERHYQGTAGRAYHDGKRDLPPGGLKWIARSRRSKFAEYVGIDDVVVEFGVGSGWNLVELDCSRKIGIDVADFLEQRLSESGIEFLTTSEGLQDGSADVIICHHMLEHVPSPADALTEMRRILSPEGRLLLHVPYETQRKWRRFDRAEPNHHLYAWNPQTLANLVEEAGFRAESAGLGRYGYDRFAAVVASKLRSGERGYRVARGLAHALRPVREVRVVASVAD
jgi:SAM-dependent methyltransferase